MLTIAQTPTSRFRTNVSRVLLLVAGLVSPVSVDSLEVRPRLRVRPANLGWMSERWLMEYRASHSK